VRDRGLDLTSDLDFSAASNAGLLLIRVLPEIDGQIVSFEQVGQWFLTELIEKLDVNASDVQQSLVLTVPVDSFEAYRHWLGRCANFAGGCGSWMNPQQLP